MVQFMEAAKRAIATSCIPVGHVQLTLFEKDSNKATLHCTWC